VQVGGGDWRSIYYHEWKKTILKSRVTQACILSQSQGKWKLHSLADYISQNDDAIFLLTERNFKWVIRVDVKLLGLYAMTIVAYQSIYPDI
jgi:hypothetical protein